MSLLLVRSHLSEIQYIVLGYLHEHWLDGHNNNFEP
eukprot:COSAG02_NODE_21335_length_792_cov_3.073593_1_plen_35_part_01